MPTHYETLDVSKTASESEIKKAYRVLSLKYHPDRNSTPEAAVKIREINDAYEVLSDGSKRRQYDLEQRMPGFGQGMGGMPGFHMSTDFDGDMGTGDINNLFSMLFGQSMGGMPGMGQGFPGMPGPGGMGMGQMHQVHHGPGGPEIRIFHGGFPPHMHQRPQKPAPIILNKTITLEQAFTGYTLPIEVERWVMIGEMKIHEEETLYITVPPGIDDNEVLLLLEKGNAVNDQCKGDIKVVIHLENKSGFKRQGLDLIYRKSISLKEALCGFAFEIPHINGKTLSLNNKSNPTIVKPNYKKVVQGLGMMRDNTYGNLIIEFEVEFPESLTAEQISAVEACL